MKNVEGKVVLITGASSGIGRETARVLAGHGAKVVLSARREDRLKALAAELGESAAYLPSDVCSPDDMRALAALAKEKFGRVDVLFANAGIMPGSSMSELKVSDWMAMVEEFYKNVGLEPEVIANAVLYAVSQPDNVDVSDLGVRPSLEV